MCDNDNNNACQVRLSEAPGIVIIYSGYCIQQIVVLAS